MADAPEVWQPTPDRTNLPERADTVSKHAPEVAPSSSNPEPGTDTISSYGTNSLTNNTLMSNPNDTIASIASQERNEKMPTSARSNTMNSPEPVTYDRDANEKEAPPAFSDVASPAHNAPEATHLGQGPREIKGNATYMRSVDSNTNCTMISPPLGTQDRSMSGAGGAARRPAGGRHHSQRGEEQPWKNDMCAGCCKPPDLAFESLCCCCVLAGRTHQRTKAVPSDRITSVNGYCISCCLLSIFPWPLHCSWVMMMVQRREIRYRYNLKGSGLSDCCLSFWFPWCTLVQEEKEVVQREGEGDGFLDDQEDGYGREQQMTYTTDRQ